MEKHTENASGMLMLVLYMFMMMGKQPKSPIPMSYKCEGTKMQKLINGILYDTEKAEKIAEKDNGMEGKFHQVKSLYRGKNGHYFFTDTNIMSAMLAFMGNADEEKMKAFADTLKAEITPIDEQRAKDWVGNVLGLDEYRKIFGEPEEA